ncbi:MAG: hypothetical protein AAB796_01000 [Patescibacteria group bacterium]
MYDDNRPQRDFGPRPKFTPPEGVTWTCAQCNTTIPDLPFQPRADESGQPTSPLYCFNCNKERRAMNGGPRGGGFRPNRRF